MSKLQRADAERREASDLGPDFLEALARGLRILSAFSAERRQMTLSDAARAIGLPRATVRRALYTLARLNYVETEGRLFRLTPKVLELAAAYLTSNPISSLLQPVCERLCGELDADCSVAVLEGEEVVMIARASPLRPVSVGLGVGYRVPAFCSALGRVLLSGLEDEALDTFLARLHPRAPTAETLIDKPALKGAILRAREEGFALVDQEAEVGFRSLAVPVWRYDGRLIAAMNLGSQVERVPLSTMLERFLPRLKQVAADLRVRLI